MNGKIKEYSKIIGDGLQKFHKWSDTHYYSGGDSKALKSIMDHSVFGVCSFASLLDFLATGELDGVDFLAPALGYGMDIVKNKGFDFVYKYMPRILIKKFKPLK